MLWYALPLKDWQTRSGREFLVYDRCMADGKNVFESFREVVQDLLVPELKAVKVSIDSLRTEMKMSNEATRGEMKINNDALREEMKFRYEALEKMIANSHDSLAQLIRQSEERNERSIQVLAEKFDGSVQIRERLATLEARMPKQ